jgi:hypothetical protein
LRLDSLRAPTRPSSSTRALLESLGGPFSSELAGPVTVNNAAGNVVVELSADASSYEAGDSVELTATLSADVETTVDRLSVAVGPEGVQDSSQVPRLLLRSALHRGDQPEDRKLPGVIDEPGDYVAWETYYRDGSWRWLAPEEEFTVERSNTAPQITAHRAMGAGGDLPTGARVARTARE